LRGEVHYAMGVYILYNGYAFKIIHKVVFMDKRYKFIRSKNPFEGLEDYRDSPTLSVKEKNIIYPLQRSMFNGFESPSSKDEGCGLRTNEGHVFELIDHSIYGGHIKSIYHKNCVGHKEVISSEPDISDKKRGILREVKAVSPGNSLNLRDTQIAKYALLQTKNYFKNPPKIFFDIFRHGVRGMQKKYKDRGIEDLVEDLSSTIKFSLTLPFSVIFEVYSQDNNFNYRYDGGRFDSLTGLNSSTLNEFLAYPEKALTRFGLNPKDFEVEKKRFPTSSKIVGYPINSFPMLFIYDKNYNMFIDKLESKINSDEILSERFYDFTKGLIGHSDKEDFDSFEGEIPLWMKPPKEEKEGVPF
jgi:hypothetical protein